MSSTRKTMILGLFEIVDEPNALAVVATIKEKITGKHKWRGRRLNRAQKSFIDIQIKSAPCLGKTLNESYRLVIPFTRSKTHKAKEPS